MRSDACLSTLHSKIDPSELAAKGVLRARRRCCLRRETAFSPESAAGSSDAGSYRITFSTSSMRGADRRWILELAYFRAAGDGQAFPTRERYRVFLFSS